MTADQVAKWERTVDVARSCGILVEPNSMFEVYDRYAREIGSFATIDEVYAFMRGYKEGRRRWMNNSNQEAIIEAVRDLVAASRRLRAKFGTDKQGKLRDWTEWKDLVAACDAVDRLAAKREEKATP